jgi:diguanylate cyclase (GGDEF)-like protein
MSKPFSHPAEAEALGLAEENALLRASLAEMRERSLELEALADRDALTGLPNRRQFLQALERAVSQAERHGTPGAVLLVDLRGLKAINEAHGRLAGDAAIIHVAKLLSDLIRSTDLAARVGDDVFGLILDHLDHDSAIDASERIARCIAAEPADLGRCTVSVEAAVATAGILAGDSSDDVLARAEASLARAKQG